MIAVGLTGSIGMGKTTVAAMFGALGAARWDADDAVHRLYAKGGAGVGPVGQLFPDAVVGGVVERALLSAIVVGDAAAMEALEAVVHPLVAADRALAISRAADAGAAMIVLDIPLLYETGGAASVYAVVVVSAAPGVQRARVLARPGMTPEKFKAILARQTPDADKRACADYVIHTGGSLEETAAQVAEVYQALLARKPRQG